MSDVKISELPAASAVASANEFEINEAGTSKKVTATQIATFANAQTWAGTAVAGQYGGTGVANTGKTITLGGNLVTSGAYAVTFTLTGATGVTLPTTGTLSTVAGSENLTNKTVTGGIFSGGTEPPYAFSAGTSFDIGTRSENFITTLTNGAATVTLPNPSSHNGRGILLWVKYGGTHTLAFSITGGSSIVWPSATAPTATSVNGKTDKYVFVSDGANWHGSDAGRNCS